MIWRVGQLRDYQAAFHGMAQRAFGRVETALEAVVTACLTPLPVIGAMMTSP